MCLDANRDPTHHELQQLCWNWLIKQNYEPSIEFRLPNRRIADIYCETRHGSVIIECKTFLTPSLADEVWKKYHDYCNYLFIAGPEWTVAPAASEKAALQWRGISNAIGYIFVRNWQILQASAAQWHLCNHRPAVDERSQALLLSPSGAGSQQKSPETI